MFPALNRALTIAVLEVSAAVDRANAPLTALSSRTTANNLSAKLMLLVLVVNLDPLTMLRALILLSNAMSATARLELVARTSLMTLSRALTTMLALLISAVEVFAPPTKTTQSPNAMITTNALKTINACPMVPALVLPTIN